MADTAQNLSLLRQELLAEGHFPYFYYDGAHLLLMASNNRKDKELAAQAFAKCNIKDISCKEYVTLLRGLALDKINVAKAAVKILEDSTFSFYVDQHAMGFHQVYCLSYCLLPLDPSMYVDTLITHFKTTKQIRAQKFIITTLCLPIPAKEINFYNL